MSTDYDASFTIEAFDSAPHPHALAGVLFAEEFDLADDTVAAIGTSSAPPAAPQTSYDQADLQQARELGYDSGWSGALAAMQTATHDGEAAARNALTRALETADQAARATTHAHCEVTAVAILRSLAAALPNLCAHHGAAEAAALTQALMPLLAHQPTVVIRANPHSLATLADVLDAQLAEPGGRVRLIGTDAMYAGDVSIEWPDGSARRDAGALSRALRDALRPLGVFLDEPPTSSIHAGKDLAHVG